MKPYLTLDWLTNFLDISADKALALALILYHYQLVEVKILVYARKNDKEPMAIRDWMEGPMPPDGNEYHYQFAIANR